jgi:hypothetical protein
MPLKEVLDAFKALPAQQHYKEQLDQYRAKIDEAAGEVEEERSVSLTKMQELIRDLDAMVKDNFENIDWKQLKEESPDEYLLKREEMREKEEKLAYAKRASLFESQKQQESHRKQREAFLAREAELLLSEVPQWKDREVFAKDHAVIQRYLASRRFDPQTINGIEDSRFFRVAWEAAQWSSLQKDKPMALKKVASAPKLLKPEARRVRETGDKKVIEDLRRTLKRTGDDKVAAELIRRRFM